MWHTTALYGYFKPMPTHTTSYWSFRKHFTIRRLSLQPDSCAMFCHLQLCCLHIILLTVNITLWERSDAGYHASKKRGLAWQIPPDRNKAGPGMGEALVPAVSAFGFSGPGQHFLHGSREKRQCSVWGNGNKFKTDNRQWWVSLVLSSLLPSRDYLVNCILWKVTWHCSKFCPVLNTEARSYVYVTSGIIACNSHPVTTNQAESSSKDLGSWPKKARSYISVNYDLILVQAFSFENSLLLFLH